MSEIKDTPWTVENVEYGDEVSDDLCILASSPSFRHIAHISPCYSGVRVPDMERAHANLIAAAPELLEALILLEAEMVASGNAGSVDYGWKPAIEKTRAAIAKATGSQS